MQVETVYSFRIAAQYEYFIVKRPFVTCRSATSLGHVLSVVTSVNRAELGLSESW